MYHFGCFEARNSVDHALAQSFCVAASILLFELGGDRAQLLNVPGDTEPLHLLRLVRVGLAVDAEVGVILPFDQPVSAPLAIEAPRLHGERDVRVELVFGRPRLVRVVDHDLDLLVLVEAPQGQGVEECDLRCCQHW